MAVSPLSAEKVILKNGDIITGSVDYLKGTIKVKPEYTDRILLNSSVVKIIKYDNKGGVDRLEELDDEELKEIIKNAPSASDYPSAGSITLLEEKNVVVKDDNTIETTTHYIGKIFKERDKDLANYSTRFYREYESVEVELARSIKPDGKIFYLKADSIKVTAANSKYPLYDRVDILQFTIPEVKEGDVIEYVVKRKTQIMDILNFPDISTYFRESEPVLQYKRSLRYPEDSEFMKKYPFKYKLFNFTDGDTPEVKIERRGKNYTVDIEYGKSLGMIYEENRPPFKDIVPRIVASSSIDYKKIASEVYFRLSDTKRDGNGIDELVRRICSKNRGSRFKIAKKIYEFVAYKIKKVGFSIFITSLYPNTPEKILEEKYGNSLDRLVLLYSMFEKAGFSPQYLLVRKKTMGRMDREVPSVYDFSSLLVRIKLDGQYLYICNPSSNRRMGVLPKGYQGSVALLLSSDGGKFVTIPVEPVERDLSEIDAKLELKENGDLFLDEREIYYGNEGIPVRASFRNMKPEERRRNIKYSLESE